MGDGRGILYMVWGSNIDGVLDRSRRSVTEMHPDLPVEIIRLETEKDPFPGLLQKATMLNRSPFEETLYLDADTVVLGRLEYGFEKAKKHGIACSICECPWAKRYTGLIGRDLIEYNTGVIFFTKVAAPLFATWERLVAQIDSSLVFVREQKIFRMPYNDQAGFAASVEETGFLPFVLPLNWNFRPQWHRSFFGPIRIWHDYSKVPDTVRELARYYERPDSIIQYHSF